MKASAVHLSPKPDFAEIRRLSTLIPEPKNYYKGITVAGRVLPENILCFARHGISDLLDPDSRQRTQHHRCVLVVSLHGSGRVCLDSDSYMLEEGQAQLIFPFQFHSYMEVQPDDICWVFVTFESFSLAEIDPLRSSPSRTLSPTEILLLRELIQCWLEKDRHGLLPLHLGLLLGRLSAMGPTPKSPTTQPPGGDANLLARVNRYIFSRLNRSFGLKELALATGQSESHLRARFRAATGCSIGRHIRQLRIQQACNLLYTTALTISEVGENCGFESVYSFSRTFKMECGVSPRDYRRERIRIKPLGKADRGP